jgi:hypothetical protein
MVANEGLESDDQPFQACSLPVAPYVAGGAYLRFKQSMAAPNSAHEQ